MQHHQQPRFAAGYRVVRAMFYRDNTSIFSVLRNRDFRNLWIGQLISFVGDALALNTLTLAIIRMANDTGTSYGKTLATLMVLSALPSLLLGMIAGTIVDRSDRRKVMIWADIIRGFFALGYLFVRDYDQVWIFIVVSVMLHSVSTFFYPARTALLPTLLKKDELLPANALAQLTQTLSYVAGAAVAGVLVGAFGTTAPSFIVDSLTFFASAVFIARISISGKIERDSLASSAIQRGAQAAKRTLKARIAWTLATIRVMGGELWTGLRYVFTDQIMRGVLVSFLAMMLGLGAANVTFVPLLINELGMPEEGLGVVRFSQTLGIIAGSAIVVTSLTKRYRPGAIIGGSMVAFGIMTMVVSVVGGYALMVAVLFVVGLTISPPQIVASTLMQRHVPSEQLGRASGAQGTIIQVANITSMGAAGLLMDEIGSRPVFTLSGLLIFSAGFVSWWVLRGVRETPDEESSEALSQPQLTGESAPPLDDQELNIQDAVVADVVPNS